MVDMGLRVQVGGLDRQSMAAPMRRAKASAPFLLIFGAEGKNANIVNGLWKLMDDGQGGVAYRKDGADYYIYYSVSGECWFVGILVANEPTGVAHTEDMEADSLPIDARRWEVSIDKGWQEQSLQVRWGLSGCFGLGAEWGGPRLDNSKMAY